MNLKSEHRQLYERIRDLTILKIFLGLALVLPSVSTPNAEATILEQIASLRFWGAIFFLHGLALFFSLYQSHSNYRIARKLMLFGVFYNMIWLLSLAHSVVMVNPGALGVTMLWAYYTRNVYHIANDPGWKTVQILKETNVNPEVENNGE